MSSKVPLGGIVVSIHAPRAGRDVPCIRRHRFKEGFNPRTPRGVRPQRRYHCKNRRCFNPRTPRGVRRVSQRCRSPDSCFNPRTPRGVRHVAVHRQRTDWRFQSTRPVRSATPRHADLEHIVSFQSTRPVRGATRFNGPNQAFFLVSIHAPRAGRDSSTAIACNTACGFNPRAPCGARHRYFIFLLSS